MLALRPAAPAVCVAAEPGPHQGPVAADHAAGQPRTAGTQPTHSSRETQDTGTDMCSTKMKQAGLKSQPASGVSDACWCKYVDNQPQEAETSISLLQFEGRV